MAFIRWFSDKPYGYQTKFAKEIGLDKVVINGILKERRRASELTKHLILKRIGYSYDEFLKFGGSNDKPKEAIPMRREYDNDNELQKLIHQLVSVWQCADQETKLTLKKLFLMFYSLAPPKNKSSKKSISLGRG